MTEWILLYDPTICSLQDTHFRFKDTNSLKVNRWKNHAIQVENSIIVIGEVNTPLLMVIANGYGFLEGNKNVLNHKVMIIH